MSPVEAGHRYEYHVVLRGMGRVSCSSERLLVDVWHLCRETSFLGATQNVTAYGLTRKRYFRRRLALRPKAAFIFFRSAARVQVRSNTATHPGIPTSEILAEGPRFSGSEYASGILDGGFGSCSLWFGYGTFHGALAQSSDLGWKYRACRSRLSKSKPGQLRPERCRLW